MLLLAAVALTAVLPPLRTARPIVGSQQPQPPGAGHGPSQTAADVGAIDLHLQQETSTLQGSYGISVIDLSTGLAYGINANTSYRAASINKMPILITLYQRADAGAINLDEAITLSDDDIQHYGTGLIQDPGAGRTFTLRQLAAAMIETSDNTAAYVLERYLGPDVIQANVQRWGLTHTSMADNTTTPADVVALFLALKGERLLQPESTGIVLSLLQHTVFDDRIVGGVPPGVAVAHKIGTDSGVYNDAGIVLAPGHPYAIAVLSQNADESEAEPALARLSGAVYRFESSLPGPPSSAKAP